MDTTSLSGSSIRIAELSINRARTRSGKLTPFVPTAVRRCPRRELFPLEVGLTLVSDEPSGDISWYCDKDPEEAWRSIRFGGINDGDLLSRAIRAARFAIDEISGS